MHLIQQQAFDALMTEARAALTQQQWPQAMLALQRAHVLGQRWVWPHLETHWLMLILEWRRRRFGAACGQVVRMVLGVIGSFVGKVPTGNTGDSDVSMFQSMPIDPELQQIIDSTAVQDPNQHPK